MLQAWLEASADRLDPVRFQRIIALERRTAAQEGKVRRLLDERLAELIHAYAEDLDTANAAAPSHAKPAELPAARPQGPLADLIEHIASRTADPDAARGDALVPQSQSGSSVFNELRQACAEIRTASQLRQVLTPAPADAGPLNSASLVHRALTLMRDLSPDYLEHFVAYIDALSGLEPICTKHTAPPDTAPRPASGGKQSRAKPRRRSG
jgi:hypothetical protein